MNIKIKREKLFVGSPVPYHCIINYDLKDFRDYIIQENYMLSEDYMKTLSFKTLMAGSTRPVFFNIERFFAYLKKNNLADKVKIITLKNGETLNVEMDTDLTIFPAAFTTAGVVFGNQIYTSKNELAKIYLEKAYVVKTKFGWSAIKLTISDATK